MILYNKKLKIQIAKLLNIFEISHKFEKENIELKNENSKLKHENFKLKNYIENTFNVVKYMFDFPLDSFKRIVDKFIETFKEK